MQDYIDFAEKNECPLTDEGKCQFCGANTKRGIHECLEIFNLGFKSIDFSKTENHIYRFLIVDAHALQHSEIHGRWSNHFHLTRLHLVFKYDIKWTYELSPKLSRYLNKYKIHKQDENLIPPELLKRGEVNTTDVVEKSINETTCKDVVRKWALEVYNKWSHCHDIVDNIARGYLNK